MSDFEDSFGAGADAVDIIDGYSNEYERGSKRRKSSRWSRATADDLEDEELERQIEAHIKLQDELDLWCASMISRGYVEGPVFPLYDELSAWDHSNTRPHVRRPSYRGYVVYFTDGQPYTADISKNNPVEVRSSLYTDDEIPY